MAGPFDQRSRACLFSYVLLTIYPFNITTLSMIPTIHSVPPSLPQALNELHPLRTPGLASWTTGWLLKTLGFLSGADRQW